jgi:hypothetical protein
MRKLCEMVAAYGQKRRENRYYKYSIENTEFLTVTLPRAAFNANQRSCECLSHWQMGYVSIVSFVQYSHDVPNRNRIRSKSARTAIFKLIAQRFFEAQRRSQIRSQNNDSTGILIPKPYPSTGICVGESTTESPRTSTNFKTSLNDKRPAYIPPK